MTLPLHGTASSLRGFEPGAPPHVVRMASPTTAPMHASDMALVHSSQDIDDAIALGYGGIVLISDDIDVGAPGANALPRLMVLPSRFDYLRAGDILGCRPESGKFRTLFRAGSAHNSFLITERCNHYCLMCSQPPKNIDDGWIVDEIRAAIPLMPPETRSFAFTGGEPLLDSARFIELLDLCRDVLPKTTVHVLTNGRAFARNDVVSAWAKVGHPSLSAGIPIYSAVDHVHDYVVQARGAFDETVLGILKLKNAGQRVEIRVVLHAITAPRIVETATWLARNLPFVDHVALMGLENTGFAIANEDTLWIDPLAYKDNLAEAVELLATANLNVSVYNLPRCLLARSVWPFAIQSISDWKNGFVEACDRCVEKPGCSGFFTSGRPRYSPNISPILAG